MKSFVLSLLLLSCLCCFADDTNIIAMSDWSAPVEFNRIAVRGRLLIVESSQPALGWPASKSSARMFIELQKVSPGTGTEFYVDTVSHLNCELVNKDGTSVPLAPSGGWDGGGGRLPYRVVLPSDSIGRIFVADGPMSPLVIHPNGIPSRRWSIPAGDTNVYYLSGTLSVITPENQTNSDWEGKLVFPKTKILANKQ
jgi:hypothetical protein